MPLRNPTLDESRLLDFLFQRAHVQFEPWRDTLLVSDMSDGGMGSFQLFPHGIDTGARVFGRQGSECQFKDEDGVDVIATLNLDQNGEPFELDIWKTNFSKLIRIPEQF